MRGGNFVNIAGKKGQEKRRGLWRADLGTLGRLVESRGKWVGVRRTARASLQAAPLSRGTRGGLWMATPALFYCLDHKGGE